jgi:predicted amidohydrolase
MNDFVRSIYSADPADLFVQLYDALPESLFRGWQPTAWSGDPAVKKLANEVYEELLDFGTLAEATVARIIAEPTDHRGIFTVLRGIDWALADVSPFSGAYAHGRLTYLAVRYTETGNFASGKVDGGALLARCAYPGGPARKKEKSECFSVHRVPADWWGVEIRQQLLAPAYDVHFPADEPIPVGCAPVLANFTDIDIDFTERYGETVYRLTPADTQRLRERISAIIKRLDDSGARIAVMPEATLSDGLLEHWRSELRRTATRRAPLRWLLVGSGPLGNDDPPYNRAVLLDRRTGDVIMTQDKLKHFTLVEKQIVGWGIPGAPKGTAAEEYIQQGSAVNVLESSLGRLAVLICEDFPKSVGWERELLACGVSHLLVPIFSKPIMRYRWEQIAAERATSLLGTWIVVSNSLVVKGPAGGTGDLYSCLVMGPLDPERRTYDFSVEFGRAETADRLGLTQNDELPEISPGVLDPAWSPARP